MEKQASPQTEATRSRQYGPLAKKQQGIGGASRDFEMLPPPPKLPREHHQMIFDAS